MKQLREPMIDHAGNVRIGVPVKVLIAGGTTLAALWSNSNGTGALANPINTDTDGLVKAYLADGNYDLVVNPGSPSSFTIYNFQHVDLIGLKAQVLADYAAAVTGAAQVGGEAAAESAVNAARAELLGILTSAVTKDATGDAVFGVESVSGHYGQRYWPNTGGLTAYWMENDGALKWGVGPVLGAALAMSLDFNGRLKLEKTPLLATKTPASASAAGTTGEIGWDSSFIYICIATNTWKRVAIATW